jgi:hypothetical protein
VPREGLVVYVNRPRVAILRDNARHYLVERVATFRAALLEVGSVARNHGSGFLTRRTVAVINGKPKNQNGSQVFLVTVQSEGRVG